MQFGKFNTTIFLLAILLTFLGLISIYSSKGFSFFLHQSIFIGIGIVLLFVLSRLDYRIFRDNSYLLLTLYFLFIILLFVLLFLPAHREVKSWYRFGSFSFNPSEFTKIILILLLAKYFSKRHIELYRSFHIFVSLIYTLIPVFLIYLQPDLGSAIVFLVIWFGILFVSGIRLRHFIILMLFGGLIAFLSWQFLLADYQKERIKSFIQPNYKPLEIGWNQRQAKIAIGEGGFLGQGFKKGSQIQKGFLPEPHTDFIFSAIAEEFGLIGSGMVLILSSFLIYLILKVGISAKDNFARLFAIGYALLLFSHLLINLGANIGFLPIIGIPLPFVSYGGSFLISCFIGLGIIESIIIHSPKLKEG